MLPSLSCLGRGDRLNSKTRQLAERICIFGSWGASCRGGQSCLMKNKGRGECEKIRLNRIYSLTLSLRSSTMLFNGPGVLRFREWLLVDPPVINADFKTFLALVGSMPAAAANREETAGMVLISSPISSGSCVNSGVTGGETPNTAVDGRNNDAMTILWFLNDDIAWTTLGGICVKTYFLSADIRNPRW